VYCRIARPAYRIPLTNIPVIAIMLLRPAAPLIAEDKSRSEQVPKEVRALEGTYTGSWTLYGIDAIGGVVKKMTWTVAMTATAASVVGNRAQVLTSEEWSSKVTFEGRELPPFKLPGKEGYFLKADGRSRQSRARALGMWWKRQQPDQCFFRSTLLCYAFRKLSLRVLFSRISVRSHACRITFSKAA
jgi:hypothetical protein